MKKIKLALMFLNEEDSGIERVIYGIIKGLKNKKIFDITLICNNEISKDYFGINKLHIGNIGKGILSLRSNIPLVKKNLFNELNLKRFDLINLHSDSPIEIYGRLNFKDIPIVSTFHGTDIMTLYNSNLGDYKILKRKGLFYLIKMIYYKISIKPYLLKTLEQGKIILLNKDQIKYVPKEYLSNVKIMPNGVDLDVFKPLNKIKQKKNVILFAGRFIDIKGIQEIVNVAKKLPQYEFWFAGKGPLENLINLPNTKNLGFKTTEQLVKLYNQATICIFPSHREAFPLCGLEAMACGRAVISTPLGFSGYIENGKDGIIIPAKDETALKNAIVDLMTNEKKRKMLEKNARKKALQYSWDNVCIKYIKFFKEVIRSKK